MTTIQSSELDRIVNNAAWRRVELECEDTQQVHDEWDRRKSGRGDRRQLSRKPHRRVYTGAKAAAGNCRNHGACSWCAAARQYQDRLARRVADEQIREFAEEVGR